MKPEGRIAPESKTTGAPELTVVLPTYNERESLPRVVEEIHRALAGISHEIIVVDSHSPDRTGEWVETASRTDDRLRLVRDREKSGLSAAVLEGFRAARGEKWVVMDADGQHDPAVLPQVCRALEGKELVVPSRYAAGGSTGRWTPTRWLGSRGATWLAQLILNVPLSDPLSGYFGIRREAFSRVAPQMQPKGFKILLELYYRLSRRRRDGAVAYAEVPYGFRSRIAGRSKLTDQVVWEYLRMLIALRRESPWPQGLTKFFFVGAGGTTVNCGLLWLLVQRAHWHYLLAAPIAIQLAILHNFFWNDRWTFSDRRAPGRGLIRFGHYELTCAIGMLVNWMLLAMLVGWAHWPLVPSNLCGIAAGATITFAMSKLWTWKRHPNAATT